MCNPLCNFFRSVWNWLRRFASCIFCGLCVHRKCTPSNERSYQFDSQNVAVQVTAPLIKSCTPKNPSTDFGQSSKRQSTTSPRPPDPEQGEMKKREAPKRPYTEKPIHDTTPTVTVIKENVAQDNLANITQKPSTPKSKKLKKDDQSPEQSVQIDSNSFKRPGGRGIEGKNNSCYMDSTLFALFYYGDTFDSRLLAGKESKPTRNEVSDQVTRHLCNIVKNLRGGYCPASLVEELRGSLVHINNRITHDMMDVDEFLSNLFGKALHLLPMVKYYIRPGVETGNFLHQILIFPSKPREDLGTVQDLLVESMGMQNLKFAAPPDPALIIKMPRSNGKLIGHKAILPNLTIDVAQFLADGESSKDGSNAVTKFDLRAVIVLRGMHYTVFVRCGCDATSPWDYFNDLPASIQEVSGITEGLESLEKELNNAQHVGKLLDGNHSLSQIVRDIHVCIYVPKKETSTQL